MLYLYSSCAQWMVRTRISTGCTGIHGSGAHTGTGIATYTYTAVHIYPSTRMRLPSAWTYSYKEVHVYRPRCTGLLYKFTPFAIMQVRNVRIRVYSCTHINSGLTLRYTCTGTRSEPPLRTRITRSTNSFHFCGRTW